jgi:ABC-2 type transport system ATP-binding protein
MSGPLLVLDNLQLGYRGRTVLTGLNLTLDRGRWVALVGPNASGKTTLLRAISGRHEPERGSIKINGLQLYPGSATPGALPGFAIPPEELPDFLTPRQCIDIYANAHGLEAPPPRCVGLFELLGLGAHATTLVRHTSLGTRQKLAIVLALMMPTPLLLLDEVFNGLDFSSALKLRANLQERVDLDGLTVLLATHSLDVVLRCCDELILLDSGRLVKRWEMSNFTGADGLGVLERALADAG